MDPHPKKDQVDGEHDIISLILLRSCHGRKKHGRDLTGEATKLECRCRVLEKSISLMSLEESTQSRNCAKQT